MATITKRNDNFTELMKDKYMKNYPGFACERDSRLSNVYHISCNKFGIKDITIRIMYPARDSHNNIKSNSTIINNIKDIERTGTDSHTFYIFSDSNGNLYEVPGDVLYNWCVENGMKNSAVQVAYTPDKKYMI